MIYCSEDQSFVYAEVELKYSSMAGKKKSKEKPALTSATSETAGLTDELRGIQKKNWNEYSMILTTIHLSSMSKYSEEIGLSSLISKENNLEEKRFKVLTYDQLRIYAAFFVYRVTIKHSMAASRLGKQIAEKDTSISREIRGMQAETTKEIEHSSFGSRQPSIFNVNNASVSKMNALIEMDNQQKMEWTDKALSYEETIIAYPPVVGRVMICGSLNKIMIRIIDHIKNTHYDIPISLYKASQKCMIPTKLLYKEYYTIGKRILDCYKDIMLKQYYELSTGNLINSVEAYSPILDTFVKEQQETLQNEEA